MDGFIVMVWAFLYTAYSLLNRFILFAVYLFAILYVIGAVDVNMNIDFK